MVIFSFFFFFANLITLKKSLRNKIFLVYVKMKKHCKIDSYFLKIKWLSKHNNYKLHTIITKTNHKRHKKLYDIIYKIRYLLFTALIQDTYVWKSSVYEHEICEFLSTLFARLKSASMHKVFLLESSDITLFKHNVQCI